MDFEKSTGNYIAKPEDAIVLGDPSKTIWTPDEVDDLIDSAALAATRLAGADLSELPLSGDAMKQRFKYEADVRRVGSVLKCLKQNSSLSEEDYDNLRKGLSY